MKIGDREIGLDRPAYVIAEIGVNHDGEVARALELTDAAAECGADAVKLQYFETDRLMSKAAKLAAYQRAAGETDPISMLRRLELDLDEMAQVIDRAHERGIHAIVTVFSTELVDAAETLDWDAYKTASPDIVHTPLLRRLAATGRPLILSTGATEFDELPIAESAVWRGNVVAFLHCVSCYPTSPADAAIGGVFDIADSWLRYWSTPEEYGLGPLAGYSDHTQEIDSGALAVSLGACVIEKHLTYSIHASGPDHAASLEPAGFVEYVSTVRAADPVPSEPMESRAGVLGPCMTLGRAGARLIAESDIRVGELSKRVLACERDVRGVSRQSVVSTGDIAAGTVIGGEHLTVKRPGTGILAYRLDDVIGKTTARDIEGDVPIVEDDLVGGLA